MKRILNISVFLFFITGFTITLTAADKIYCDQCENEIRHSTSYITTGDKNYCCTKCYEKSLPKCSVCGEPLKNGGLVSDGKNFCSEECYKTTWDKCHLCGKLINAGYHFGDKTGVVFCKECMEAPKCFNCGHPTDHKKLLDGRYICKECDNTSINDKVSAQKIFNEVRDLMNNDLKLKTNHQIDFKLVDIVSLNKESESQFSEDYMEHGLFVHEQRIRTIVKTKSVLGLEFDKQTEERTKNVYKILILYSLPRDKFIEVAAHELAHDWMQAHYPNINDLKISEGWAEFIASQVNIIYGNSYLNKRMKNNSSSVYGDGYRYVAGYAKEHGVAGLYELFKEMNKK